MDHVTGDLCWTDALGSQPSKSKSNFSHCTFILKKSALPLSQHLHDGRLVNRGLCWVLARQVLWPELCHCSSSSSLGPLCQLFPSGARKAPSTSANKVSCFVYGYVSMRISWRDWSIVRESHSPTITEQERWLAPGWHKINQLWPLTPGNSKLIALRFHWDSNGLSTWRKTFLCCVYLANWDVLRWSFTVRWPTTCELPPCWTGPSLLSALGRLVQVVLSDQITRSDLRIKTLASDYFTVSCCKDNCRCWRTEGGCVEVGVEVNKIVWGQDMFGAKHKSRSLS